MSSIIFKLRLYYLTLRNIKPRNSSKRTAFRGDLRLPEYYFSVLVSFSVKKIFFNLNFGLGSTLNLSIFSKKKIDFRNFSSIIPSKHTKIRFQTNVM